VSAAEKNQILYAEETGKSQIDKKSKIDLQRPQMEKLQWENRIKYGM